MEFLIEIIDWFWKLELDNMIIPWVKANTIPVGILLTILRWWVKRTPSTEDDELLDRLKGVLPMLKKR